MGEKLPSGSSAKAFYWKASPARPTMDRASSGDLHIALACICPSQPKACGKRATKSALMPIGGTENLVTTSIRGRLSGHRAQIHSQFPLDGVRLDGGFRRGITLREHRPIVRLRRKFPGPRPLRRYGDRRTVIRQHSSAGCRSHLSVKGYSWTCRRKPF